MRFVRFRRPDGGIRWGLLEPGESAAVIELEGDPFCGFAATAEIHSREGLALLAPVQPSKIVALGSNFRDHAAEMGHGPPPEPRIFLKPPSALIGPRAAIELPPVEGPIEHEAELAVVIGRPAKCVREADALRVVLGYTCLNDVTARLLQKHDGVYARAKGFDTFAPVGPWITTDGIPEDFRIECRVNGALRQQGDMRQAIVSVTRAIAFISNVMRLEPGDVIAMGTPAGVGPLVPGDTVEVRIDGIGSLENPVVSRKEEA